MINRKILVLAAYPITNPQHGGQKRTKALFDHYQKIMQEVQFTAVYKTGVYQERGPHDCIITDKKILDRMSKSPYNAAVITGEAAYEDIEVKKRLTAQINRYRPEIIHIEQPFLYRSIKKIVEECNLEVSYIFSSQNVEYKMKEDTFIALEVPTKTYKPIVEYIYQLESEFCKEAALTIAVSKSDASEHVRMGADDCIVALNGISEPREIEKDAHKYPSLKTKYNLKKIGLFVGSAHPPNWKGFEKIIGTDTSYISDSSMIFIVGGVCDYFSAKYPKDHLFWKRVIPLGRLSEDELSSVLAESDLLLLPIISGGGSNLKTAEALLTEKPVIGTSFAFRGYEEFKERTNVIIANKAIDFRNAIKEVLDSKNEKILSASEKIQTKNVLWESRLRELEAQIKANKNLWKPTVYIDVTRLYQTRALTGIQRVVRSLLPLMIEKNEIYETKAIFYDVSRDKYAVFKDSDIVHLAKSLETGLLNPTHEIDVVDIGSGDIFFDLDLVWTNKPDRRTLYKQLKKNGASVFAYIYDLTPILLPHRTHPESVKMFPKFLDAVAEYADLVFTDSRSSEKDFSNYQLKHFPEKQTPTVVTRLGSDFPIKTKLGRRKKEVNKMKRRKYILCVGTIEPRKSQRLLLRAFRLVSMFDEKVHLVYVGKKGWLSDDFIDELTSDQLFGRRIHWLQGVDDHELEKLYKNSYLNVYLSEYEGYGLPIAESLSYGKPTITSNNSSMYEVGTDFADYVRYGTEVELAELLKAYLLNKELYTRKSKKIIKHYAATKWESVFTIIDQVIRNHILPPKVGGHKRLQHVMISIRPSDFQRCVERTDKFSEIVKEYIVITKPSLVRRYKAIKSKHPIHVVSEKRLLGNDYLDFKKAPHQKKNWLLRAVIPRIEALDDEFIMLDDDNLPLKKIQLSFFLESYRYKAYYYNDLLQWKHLLTSYDNGQHETAEVLMANNLQLLSYSSHSPQIINKKIYKEAVELFYPISKTRELDEWSTYFNYATTYYPEQFEKKIYETLNWPAHPGNWQAQYTPASYTYENYYDYVYEKNGFFHGLNLDGDYDRKIKLKSEQLLPYSKTDLLMNQAEHICSTNGMVHGSMWFEGAPGEKVMLLSIPYIFASTKDVTRKFKVPFKIINPQEGASYELFVQNSAGATLSVELMSHTSFAVHGFNEGVVELPIQVALEAPEIKNLNFTVKKDGRDMNAFHERYDSAMLICQLDDSVDQTLRKIPDKVIKDLT